MSNVRQNSVRVLISKTPTNNSKLRHNAKLISNTKLRFKITKLLRDVFINRRVWKNADVIIAADEFSIPISYIAARIFGKKLIICIHGTYATECLDKSRSNLYLAAYRYSCAITSVSDYTKSKLVVRLPEIEEKISVIPLSITLHNSEIMPSQMLAKDYFVAVGPLKSRKGSIYAVRAIAELRDQGIFARLILIGAEESKGKYAEEVYKQIKASQISDLIEFTGFISDTERDALIAAAIANILPSINDNQHYEGFGYVHLEANRLGVPTIGSRDCGNESAIVNGVTGYLTPQRDHLALANKMKDLYDNASLRNSLGLNGQKHLLNWTGEDIARAYGRLFQISA